MKIHSACCAALCAALLLLSACSSPVKLSQPSGRWVDANPPSAFVIKGAQ